ncbi:Nn.00g001490.m01.CDS01 [Neocucurbitaria sp. VM-36]
MKAKFRGLLPGIRWTPHDIPSPDASTSKKSKSRNPFSLRPSDPYHGELRPRKSTISLTSEPDAELDRRTHAQGQSIFFARLPIELRRMVYEYVMGEETVHLTLGTKKKFGHFICEARDGKVEGGERECGCRVLVGGRESERLSSACARMLRVCRRMYSEAVPHLYRQQVFSLLHITHLLYLPSRVPSQRLDSIRTLRLRWAVRALPYLTRGGRLAYREDTANWERGWAIIAGMQGLRDLYVVLVDPSPQSLWERNWLELEEQLLAPVKQVTNPGWFELMLPYASCGTDWDMEESRVRLRKPDGGDVEEEDN